VRHDTVDWRETFSIGSNEVDWRPEVPGGRYDLATALRIVRRMETSAGRGAVFEEIKAKNPLYRLVDGAYSLAGALALQPLVLLV
jgi:hypothetical protein